MFINPRAGHFTLGPDKNDPWYTKLLWWIILAIVGSVFYVMEFLEKLWNLIP